MTPAVPLYLSPAEVAKWINGLGAFDRQNTHIAMTILAVVGLPKSYLDVGSGTGAMVNTARSLGVEAFGLDALPRGEAWPHLIQHDLRQPFDFERPFELVTSIETAEHIDPDYVDVFCDTIARHMGHHSRLVFSAAMPGQEGDGHVNLQAANYWRKKFDDRGLRYVPSMTNRLMAALSLCDNSQHWVEANLQAFTRD